MAAIVCLPRQFQVMVVENVDPRHLRPGAVAVPGLSHRHQFRSWCRSRSPGCSERAGGHRPDTLMLALPLAPDTAASRCWPSRRAFRRGQHGHRRDRGAQHHDLQRPRGSACCSASGGLARSVRVAGSCSASGAPPSRSSCCSASPMCGSCARATAWCRSGSSPLRRSRNSSPPSCWGCSRNARKPTPGALDGLISAGFLDLDLYAAASLVRVAPAGSARAVVECKARSAFPCCVLRRYSGFTGSTRSRMACSGRCCRTSPASSSRLAGTVDQSALERSQAALFVDYWRGAGHEEGRLWRGTAQVADLVAAWSAVSSAKHRHAKPSRRSARGRGRDPAGAPPADAETVRGSAERQLAGAIGARIGAHHGRLGRCARRCTTSRR